MYYHSTVVSNAIAAVGTTKIHTVNQRTVRTVGNIVKVAKSTVALLAICR